MNCVLPWYDYRTWLAAKYEESLKDLLWRNVTITELTETAVDRPPWCSC